MVELSKENGKDLEIFVSDRMFAALPEIKDSNTICW
jgi:hypothetical protein